MLKPRAAQSCPKKETRASLYNVEKAISCGPLGIFIFHKELEDHRVLGKKELWEPKGGMTKERQGPDEERLWSSDSTFPVAFC